MSDELTVRRRTSVVLTPLALMILIGGCTQHPSTTATPTEEGRATEVDPETAQRKMTEIVDRTAAALGGEWVTTQGPDYVDSCTLPDGGEGANWVSLVTRTDEGGDPDHDAATVAGAWRSAGMTVEQRYPQPLLQRGNFAAHGPLGQTEFTRRVGQVEMAGGHQKSVDGIKRQR